MLKGAIAYAFPLESTGRWVCEQGATVACMFLVDFLMQYHNHLLSEQEVSLMQCPQALLRCMRPYLPNKDALMQAHSRVAHMRLPLTDGWLDSSSLTFRTLPYRTNHFVFGATVPHSYKMLMQLTPAYISDTVAQIADYYG